VCFYDVTNFWFEIQANDQDVIDNEGNIIKPGLRKKGVSKEHREEPIVQMGLFIDNKGNPISYGLFPGNTKDQLTLRPLFSKTIKEMNFGRVIVVSDGGTNSGANIAYLLDNGNGYIFSKSPRKCDKNEKKWLLNRDGYKWIEQGILRVKNMIRQRTIYDRLAKELRE
jgi:transposase